MHFQPVEDSDADYSLFAIDNALFCVSLGCSLRALASHSGGGGRLGRRQFGAFCQRKENVVCGSDTE